MPIFDFKCPDCGYELNDLYIKTDEMIPTCCSGKRMEKKPSRMLPGFPKHGITLENVAEQPVHFDSKKKLREFKNKHDLELGALPYD